MPLAQTPGRRGCWALLRACPSCASSSSSTPPKVKPSCMCWVYIVRIDTLCCAADTDRELAMPRPSPTNAPVTQPLFPHAMLEEIYAQPESMRQTIEHNVKGDLIFPGAFAPIENALFAFTKIIIAASGSSRHAGLAGEIILEDLAGIAVDVEYASEYCYRSTHAGADPIVLVITQSGETADTIAAQREALNRGAKTIAISNVAESTIVREASAARHTYAGPERAVPATKSFTAQLTMLYL